MEATSGFGERDDPRASQDSQDVLSGAERAYFLRATAASAQAWWLIQGAVIGKRKEAEGVPPAACALQDPATAMFTPAVALISSTGRAVDWVSDCVRHSRSSRTIAHGKAGAAA